MAALDESMGFGFGAIGGQEQSINLGDIDWSPPPKRSHSARQMPPPRARQVQPSSLLAYVLNFRIDQDEACRDCAAEALRAAGREMMGERQEDKLLEKIQYGVDLSLIHI